MPERRKDSYHIPDYVRKLAVRYNSHLGLSSGRIARKTRLDTDNSYSRVSYNKLLKKYAAHGSTTTLPKSGRPSLLGLSHYDFIDKCMLQMNMYDVHDEEKWGINFARFLCCT